MEQFHRRIDRIDAMDGRPIKRQVLAGTYPDLQHQTARGPDRPLAICGQAMVPHRQINQTRDNPMLIETHCAILGQNNGAVGFAHFPRLNLGFLSVGTTGMPLETSDEVRLDTSSRKTASANGRENEPFFRGADTRRALTVA
jgi:hypothetical protein